MHKDHVRLFMMKNMSKGFNFSQRKCEIMLKYIFSAWNPTLKVNLWLIRLYPAIWCHTWCKVKAIHLKSIGLKHHSGFEVLKYVLLQASIEQLTSYWNLQHYTRTAVSSSPGIQSVCFTYGMDCDWSYKPSHLGCHTSLLSHLLEERAHTLSSLTVIDTLFHRRHHIYRYGLLFTVILPASV